MKPRRVYRKQSAVEWMFSQLPDDFRFSDAGYKLISQARKIEKDQIIESYDIGHEDAVHMTPAHGDGYYHNYFE